MSTNMNNYNNFKKDVWWFLGEMPSKNGRYIVLDTETTGFNPLYNNVIEIAAVEISKGKLTGLQYHCYIKPRNPIDPRAVEKHKLGNNFYEDYFSDVYHSDKSNMENLLKFIGNSIIFAHNASFDYHFINNELKFWKLPTISKGKFRCTMRIFKNVFSQVDVNFKKFCSLEKCCEYFNLKSTKYNFHTAIFDSYMTGRLLCKMYEYVDNRKSIEEINNNKLIINYPGNEIQKNNGNNLGQNSGPLQAHIQGAFEENLKNKENIPIYNDNTSNIKNHLNKNEIFSGSNLNNLNYRLNIPYSNGLSLNISNDNYQENVNFNYNVNLKEGLLNEDILQGNDHFCQNKINENDIGFLEDYEDFIKEYMNDDKIEHSEHNENNEHLLLNENILQLKPNYKGDECEVSELLNHGQIPNQEVHYSPHHSPIHISDTYSHTNSNNSNSHQIFTTTPYLVKTEVLPQDNLAPLLNHIDEMDFEMETNSNKILYNQDVNINCYENNHSSESNSKTQHYFNDCEKQNQLQKDTDPTSINNKLKYRQLMKNYVSTINCENSHQNSIPMAVIATGLVTTCNAQNKNHPNLVNQEEDLGNLMILEDAEIDQIIRDNI